MILHFTFLVANINLINWRLMELNTIRKTIETLILKDDDYALQMEECVLPALDSQKEELWLPRKDDPQQKLYCARYTSFCKEEECRGIMIISHGYTENSEKYREVIYYFLKMGYHVYIPDHCGHGRSYRLTKELFLVHIDRYERYVDDLLSVAHRAKFDYPSLPVYLYGHSMGGGIAAAAVAASPELFKRVILTSPMIRPNTHPLPWKFAVLIARIACLLGKSAHHLPTGHPFDDSETFEQSSAISQVRFDYEQDIRRSDPLFQNTCGTYGWVLGAEKLNRFLMRSAWKQIQIPLLLFQAENDYIVSGKAQYQFLQKINRRHKAPTWLIKVPDSKHEIYNAEYETLVKYWTKIFRFLS